MLPGLLREFKGSMFVAKRLPKCNCNIWRQMQTSTIGNILHLFNLQCVRIKLLLSRTNNTTLFFFSNKKGFIIARLLHTVPEQMQIFSKYWSYHTGRKQLLYYIFLSYYMQIILQYLDNPNIRPPVPLYIHQILGSSLYYIF